MKKERTVGGKILPDLLSTPQGISIFLLYKHLVGLKSRFLMRKTSLIQSTSLVILATYRYNCYRKITENFTHFVTNVMKNTENYKNTVKLRFVGEKEER